MLKRFSSRFELLCNPLILNKFYLKLYKIYYKTNTYTQLLRDKSNIEALKGLLLKSISYIESSQVEVN
jgi:hypothetical protein